MSATIFVVIVGLTSVIIMMSMNTFSKGAQMSESAQIGNSVYNFMEKRLCCAMTVCFGSQGDCNESFSIENGVLMYAPPGENAAPFFDTSILGRHEISYTVQCNIAYLSLTVDVLSEGKTVFSKSSGFILLNAAALAEGASVTGNGGKDVAIYITN